MTRSLEVARCAFEAGNPLGLYDVVIYCHETGTVLPGWALAALAKEKLALLKSEKPIHALGRHARDLEKYRQASIDHFRYEAVRDAEAHRDKLPTQRGETVYDSARRLCAGTEAGGSARTIRRSFEKVERELKHPKNKWKYYTGSCGRYFEPTFYRPLAAWRESTKPFLRP